MVHLKMDMLEKEIPFWKPFSGSVELWVCKSVKVNVQSESTLLPIQKDVLLWSFYCMFRSVSMKLDGDVIRNWYLKVNS